MKIKALIGIAVSFIFVYLAFKDVSFTEMMTALESANYLWLITVANAEVFEISCDLPTA